MSTKYLSLQNQSPSYINSYNRTLQMANQGMASLGEQTSKDSFSSQPSQETYYSKFAASFAKDKKIISFYQDHVKLAEENSNKEHTFINLDYLFNKNVDSIKSLIETADEGIYKEVDSKDKKGESIKKKLLSLSKTESKALGLEIDTLSVITGSVLEGKDPTNLKTKKSFNEEQDVANRLGALLQTESKYLKNDPESDPVLLNVVAKSLVKKAISSGDEIIIYEKDKKGDYVEKADGYSSKTLLNVVGDLLDLKDDAGDKINYPAKGAADYNLKLDAYKDSVANHFKSLKGSQKTDFIDNLKARYLSKPGKALAKAVMQQVQDDQDLLSKVAMKAVRHKKEFSKKEDEDSKWEAKDRNISRGFSIVGFYGLKRMFKSQAAKSFGSWIAKRGAAATLGASIGGVLASPLFWFVAVPIGIWAVKEIYKSLSNEKPKKDTAADHIQRKSSWIGNWFTNTLGIV